MNAELEKVYERLAEMGREIGNLRQGYVIVNERYTKALSTLGDMTAGAKEAAHRASSAATFAMQATRKAVEAAREAAAHAVIPAAEEAAQAAWAAAEAAAQAAVRQRRQRRFVPRR